MLDKLFQKSSQILKLQNYSYKRYFYHTISFDDKMIGILGSRGVGKTTVIIQYLNSLNIPKHKKLYFSDNISKFTKNLVVYDRVQKQPRDINNQALKDNKRKYLYIREKLSP